MWIWVGDWQWIPFSYLIYNDITARSANIQAGMGVVLALLFFSSAFLVSALFGTNIRVQNSLMCIIYNQCEQLWYIKSVCSLHRHLVGMVHGAWMVRDPIAEVDWVGLRATLSIILRVPGVLICICNDLLCLRPV
jgi:hypothetical protein